MPFASYDDAERACRAEPELAGLMVACRFENKAYAIDHEATQHRFVFSCSGRLILFLPVDDLPMHLPVWGMYARAAVPWFKPNASS